MFTGIIEATGNINSVIPNLGNKTFWLSSPISSQLKIDQSLNHNGVCLTVEEVSGNAHRVTAITETLVKTNLGAWQEGKVVNLERCLQLNGRLDGHIVQGHADTVAECIGIMEMNGSWQYKFQVPIEFSSLIIEKGSISLNGISLTIFNIRQNIFEVAIIPYTYNHTNIKDLQTGATVNIEFDMMGKYVNRFLSLKNQ